MTAITPIGRTVREVALDLINAAEVLRESRADTLRQRDALDARWAAGQREYWERKDRA